MKVSYIQLVSPKAMVGPMNVTQGKDMYSFSAPSLSIWEKMIRTTGGNGHSPIRSVIYRIYLEGIPYWVSTHLVRHHVGTLPFVKAQGKILDRGSLPQDAPVNAIFDMNAQAILNMAKARLCRKAADQTTAVLLALKEKMLKSGNEYDMILAKYMNPPCKWYGECFEVVPCGGSHERTDLSN
jgi:hypothetical protein